jgi:DNA-binding MarR family transcriptional regulator
MSDTETIKKDFLESLLGYHCRRATLAIIGRFLDRMSVFGLRPVEFSVLSLIRHNPGITSRQICAALGILSPNLVRIISTLDERALLLREPHPSDGRAIGLHLTSQGKKLMKQAEAAAIELEAPSENGLTADEQAQLMALLKRVYARRPKR